MVDTLYVNGCSWTHGYEIETDPKFYDFLRQNKLKVSSEVAWDIVDENGYVKNVFNYTNPFTWGGVVSKKLNINNFINDGLGGTSNDRIIRKTIDFVLSYPEDKRHNLFIIIGWTSSTRKEIYVRQNKTYEIFNVSMPFYDSLFKPVNLSDSEVREYGKYHQIYVNTIFDMYECLKRKTQQIYMLSNVLDNLKIKYLFFDSIECTKDMIWKYNEENNTNHFDEFTSWPNKTNNFFTETSVQNYLDGIESFNEYGKTRHPMIVGHDIIGDLLYDLIIENNILYGK